MDPKNRWIFLIDDLGQLLNNTSSGAPSSPALSTVLPSPKNGLKRRYMISNGKLLEVHRISTATPSSWFIDQSVKSDGSLLVASMMNPLFFMLPVLQRSGGTRMSPLYQHVKAEGGGGMSSSSSSGNNSNNINNSNMNSALSTADFSILLQLHGIYDLLPLICDEMEGIEDGIENRLYRLNQDKAILWLASKVQATASALQVKADEATKRALASINTFTTTSTRISESSTMDTGAASGVSSLSSEVSTEKRIADIEQLETALTLIGEYITEEWMQKVAIHMGIPLNNVLPHLAPKSGNNSTSSSSSSSSVSTTSMATSPSGGKASVSIDGSSTSSSSSSYSDSQLHQLREDAEIAAHSDRASAWNQSALDDSMAQIQRYLQGGKGGGGTAADSPDGSGVGGAKKRPAGASQPQTVQQKRLAQTNTKGMKSMMGYFGAKKDAE